MSLAPMCTSSHFCLVGVAWTWQTEKNRAKKKKKMKGRDSVILPASS